MTKATLIDVEHQTVRLVTASRIDTGYYLVAGRVDRRDLVLRSHCDQDTLGAGVVLRVTHVARDGFGTYTRRTGLARYAPLASRAERSWRLSSNSSSCCRPVDRIRS